MFTRIRKFISQWFINQDIYIEQMIREGTIPQIKEETMRLYRTETQEDYNALMIELEEEGCLWNEKEKSTEYNCWNIFKKDTVIIIECDNILGVASKVYCERVYLDTPIEKYKAQQDIIPGWIYSDAITAFSSNRVSMKNDNKDNVNNPAHYKAGGIETLDYIKAKVKDYPSYAAGNILKYISRYEHKNGIEDLKKAQFYLNDLINWMESE
ncbi:DUF3310 domain-containing protein [Listeria monocytogenes]|nr:DUF3310 domain-containing protein [Listeria monocytogenes]